MTPDQKALKAQYKKLFASISEILLKADPIGIGYVPDEYDLEAGTILPRLPSAQSADDVQTILYEEFCDWFGPATAGSREVYAVPAAAIWELWSRTRP